jgi:uncharacterized membrane protein YkvA (DUF1232 family)
MKILNFLSELKVFLKNVAQDERIPQKDKKILLALIALLISPIDLLPDWIPIFGQLDDLIFISIILDYFFKVLDSRILLSHFPWDMKAYARLKSIAGIIQIFVPRFIRKKVWSYVGDPY